MSIIQSVLLLSTLATAFGHSWLACSDYRITESKLKSNPPDLSEIMAWDASKCQGYPRNAATQAQKTAFGVDTGYNYQPGGTGNYCGGPNAKSANNYATGYQMATWTAGSRVCLAWPTKNHVALGNIYIKDAFTRILTAPTPGTATDPTTAAGWNILADMGPSNYSSTYPGIPAGGFPRTGFQNCPNFANNGDKALCVNCIDVPSNMAAGVYTMVWAWAFNGAGDLYTNCFEVNVVSSGTSNPGTTTPSQSSSPSPSPSSGTTTTQPSATPTPSASPASTSTGGTTCTYSVVWMGGSGFGGRLQCRFPTTPQSWAVTVTWDAGTSANNAWNSKLTVNGQTNVFNNADYNGQSQSVDIGFNGQYATSTQPLSIVASINGATAQRVASTAQDYDGELPTTATGVWATNGTTTIGNSDGVLSTKVNMGMTALCVLAVAPFLL